MKNLLLIFSLMLSHLSMANSIHIKELLGSKYKNIKPLSEKVQITKINKIFSSRLPKKYKHQSKELTLLVINQAKKYNLDPYFILSVISGESSFNPDIVGPVRELGLMQLRPATGEWMAGKINMRWRGDKMLLDPVINIKLGCIYLSWLRERFNFNSQLYIAAYNMGEKNVQKLILKKVLPKQYPRHIMKRYLAFYK